MDRSFRLLLSAPSGALEPSLEESELVPAATPAPTPPHPRTDRPKPKKAAFHGPTEGCHFASSWRLGLAMLLAFPRALQAVGGPDALTWKTAPLEEWPSPTRCMRVSSGQIDIHAHYSGRIGSKTALRQYRRIPHSRNTLRAISSDLGRCRSWSLRGC